MRSIPGAGFESRLKSTKCHIMLAAAFFLAAAAGCNSGSPTGPDVAGTQRVPIDGEKSIALSGMADAQRWALLYYEASSYPANVDESGPFTLELLDRSGSVIYRTTFHRHQVADYGNGELYGWAMRIPIPGSPIGGIRIRDESGNLLLHAEPPFGTTSGSTE